MDDRILMAPSILSSDFTQLGDAVRLVQDGGADVVHVDVMDGHFVPNLTIGPPVVAALKTIATVPLDVHLMIDNVDWSIQWYLDAGADMVSVHPEACVHLHRVLQTIRAHGSKAGVALNPATSIETVRDVIGDLDYVLLMSVNPGFGGQAFIERTIDKVRELVEMCAEEGASPIIEIDGGIDTRTAPLVAAAGARMLVAGNAVFGTAQPVNAMEQIRAAAEAAM